MTICVLNQKGGVGKTTLALHLAAAWLEAHPDLTLALLDLDDQESLSRYRSSLGSRAHFEAGSWKALPDLLARPAVQNAAHTVIDAPRSLDDQTARAILSKCDALLIPLLLGYDELIATTRTLEVAKTLPDLQVKIALNGATAQPHRQQIASEARAAWPEIVTRGAISNHRVFGEAAIAGKSVLQCAPQSVPASQLRRLGAQLWNDWNL